MVAALAEDRDEVEQVQVRLHDREVGTLALAADGRVAFEYCAAWLETGFSLSPLSLPLRSGVFLPRGYEPFSGLFGIFDDSLPDGWGRLLVDRILRAGGRDPAAVGALARLRIVGSSGAGALTYHPGVELVQPPAAMRPLDELAAQAASVLEEHVSGIPSGTGEVGEELDLLFRLGGSSGGARPKVTYVVDGQPWIVKFPSRLDPVDIGVQERDYMRCAEACGIPVAPWRLMPSRRGPGYFASRRFDRMAPGSAATGDVSRDGLGADGASGPQWPEGGGARAGLDRLARVHMASAAALLETSHRIPNLDYITLVRLLIRLGCPAGDRESLVRLCAFNVFAHNRDDHSRNFSFLYDEHDRSWRLAPAYDLTLSSSLGGEHATTVAGNGRDPGVEDIVAVGREAGLSARWTRREAQSIRARVSADLGGYLRS